MKKHWHVAALVIGAFALAMCQPGGESGELVVVTEVVEIVNEQGEVITEVVTVEVEMPATEEVIGTEEVIETEEIESPAPATSVPPIETFTPEAVVADAELIFKIPGFITDEIDDCHLFSGDAADCTGNDIGMVYVAVITNQQDYDEYVDTVRSEGLFFPEIPIELGTPYLLSTFEVNNFDPSAAYYCINFGARPDDPMPSEDYANVLDACFFPSDGFAYTNIKVVEGQNPLNPSPAGTVGFTDLSTGFVLAQELREIYIVDPTRPFGLLGISMDGTVVDDVLFGHLEDLPLQDLASE